MSRWLRVADDIFTDDRLLSVAARSRRPLSEVVSVYLMRELLRRDGAAKSAGDIAWMLRLEDGHVSAILSKLDELEPDRIKPEPHRPSPHVWAQLRAEVFARDDFTCVYCGTRGRALECDHVKPVALGGTHDLENLATACRPCNRAKRAKSLEEWKA